MICSINPFYYGLEADRGKKNSLGFINTTMELRTNEESCKVLHCKSQNDNRGALIIALERIDIKVIEFKEE